MRKSLFLTKKHQKHMRIIKFEKIFFLDFSEKCNKHIRKSLFSKVPLNLA